MKNAEKYCIIGFMTEEKGSATFGKESRSSRRGKNIDAQSKIHKVEDEITDPTLGMPFEYDDDNLPSWINYIFEGGDIPSSVLDRYGCDHGQLSNLVSQHRLPPGATAEEIKDLVTKVILDRS